MPINLVACTVVDLWCDWLWDGQLNNIRICICGRVLLPPSHASEQTLFLHQSPNKHEVPPVPIHPNRSTQHQICPVYRTCQQSTPQFWNSISNRHGIGNFCVAVLITPMKRTPCFHNYSASVTDEKYESAQIIMSVLAYGITSYFSTFVPWGRLYSSSCCSSSLFVDLKILSRIIIDDCPHAAF